MALQKEAMVTSRTESARTRIIPKIQLSVIFAQAGAIKTLPVGTAVAYNTSTNGYVEWATGGANGTGTVQGIINPDPVTVTTAGEVAGVVMFAGEAHRDDLVSDGGTSAQLDTALEALIGRGLVIHALGDVRSV
jgi:hypothetical protein